jgi:hypothetical protein
MNTTTLSFGCVRAIPEGVTTAWGARLIWPNDLVYDRQDLKGPDAERLKSWLNGGALRRALDCGGQGAGLDPTADRQATLYEDESGIVVGNPQGSYGYLYVAAWLKP